LYNEKKGDNKGSKNGSPSRTYSIALKGVPGFNTTPALAPRLLT